MGHMHQKLWEKHAETSRTPPPQRCWCNCDWESAIYTFAARSAAAVDVSYTCTTATAAVSSAVIVAAATISIVTITSITTSLLQLLQLLLLPLLLLLLLLLVNVQLMQLLLLLLLRTSYMHYPLTNRYGAHFSSSFLKCPYFS